MNSELVQPFTISSFGIGDNDKIVSERGTSNSMTTISSVLVFR